MLALIAVLMLINVLNPTAVGAAVVAADPDGHSRVWAAALARKKASECLGQTTRTNGSITRPARTG
jgi:hypothetical protein